MDRHKNDTVRLVPRVVSFSKKVLAFVQLPAYFQMASVAITSGYIIRCVLDVAAGSASFICSWDYGAVTLTFLSQRGKKQQ